MDIDEPDFEDDVADFALEEDEASEAAKPLIGRVAVVGYPNVGKSTLVNRLSGTRQAIVHEKPGVTRDRKEIECEWNGERFLLIDTGGVDMGDPHAMARQITQQAEQAVAEADIVLLVVDAEAGISAADMELAELLRRRQARVMVAANKIDNYRNEAHAMEFHQLGLGEPIAVSAHHGNNTGDLLDELVDQLREHGTAFRAQADDVVRIAVLGRPNVGKSTLVNAVLGEQRVIVSDVAGTTRDSIDTAFVYEGRDMVLIDTAGIRRGRKEREAVEYYGEVRSLQAAERADIAFLLVDSSQGVKEADLSIADHARQRDCAMIVVLSKWDKNDVDLADIRETIAQKLRMRPEIITTSGVTGRNVGKLLNKAIELHGVYSSRVGTGEFNRFLAEIKEAHPPPLDKRSRRRLNLLYGTQYQTAPPRFRIFVNDRRLMTRSYGYYIENKVRERFALDGVPVIIDYRSRD
jgi:GTPase